MRSSDLYDASFLYVKSASGWRRTAIAAWTPLGAPTGVSATAGNAQATVSWTAPVDNGGYAITDYAVQYSSNSGTTWTTFADGTSTANTATVTGLTNGTDYVFRVAAINGAGTGPYSSATSSVTPGGAATDPNFANVSLLLHMDGSGSTFTDNSPSPKTLTAFGDATQSTTQSKWGGKSARLSGGYISASDASLALGSGDFTAECWVNFDSVASYQQVFSGRPNNGTYAESASLAVTPSGTLLWWNFGAVVESTISLTPSVWNHIALVRQSGTITIYINGVSAGSASGYTQNLSSQSFSVGANANGSEPITGYIDELRITKGVARYTANFTPPTAAFPDA